MLTNRRHFLAGVAAAALAGEAGCSAPGEVLTPEAFGAKGDGRTNDTAAFAALSRHVNASGGGTIALRPVTYIVGGHVAGADKEAAGTAKFAFPPVSVLRFVNCRGDVIVRGNGAVLRAQSGLRYGSFDSATGRPISPKLPFSNPKFAASPYVAMIHAKGCSGLVEISDLELDGNVSGLVIGGEYGDKGRQLPASGIRLEDNSGEQRLSRIYTHHHPLDGLTLFRPLDRTALTRVTAVRSEFNGRQGCSVTGGRNYAFAQCRFANTGKGGLRSPPGAGVDIEASRYPIRDVKFSDCEFSNNSGPGVLADQGNTEGVTFERSRLIGTTRWSAWPKKPRMRFNNCVFVGAIVHAAGDTDPARAVQFHDCLFSDDPALSPTGEVFGGRGRRELIALLPRNPNVLFNRCKFQLRHRKLLPFSTNVVIYSDCEMSQQAPELSRPRGTYTGVNRINGRVDISGSVIRGEVILNGRTLPRGAA